MKVEDKWVYVLKVLDEQGNWYTNALIENEFDAQQVYRLYRHQLGYEVKVFYKKNDITDLFDRFKPIVVID